MGDRKLTIADVFAARQVVGRFLSPTPLLRSRGLSERVGADVYVKYEDMSPIRSFKARGGIYCASQLGPEVAGLSCASTGNHGQGIAYGARLFNKKAVVVVPVGGNEQKMAAVRALGADLRVEGENLAESNEIAKRIADDEGLRYIEDGEDPDVMLGAATLGLEIVEQLPRFDALFAPVGGGNLIAACGLATKGLRSDSRLIGVQPEGAPAVYESWKAGKPLHSDQCDTFAGGLATSYPGTFTFTYLMQTVNDMTLVSDAAIADAAVVMLAETGHLPEGAGAAGLAGLLANAGSCAGQTVVVLLTGNNFEQRIWQQVRSHAGAQAVAAG
jgi:threonine dehydratase